MALVRCTHPSGTELQIGAMVPDGTGATQWWPDPAQRVTLHPGENHVPDEFWDRWCAQYGDEHRPAMMLTLGVTRLDHGGPNPLPADPEPH